MLDMYEKEKEATIYVTPPNSTLDTNEIQKSGQVEYVDEPHDDNDSDNYLSEESYHSHVNTDNEDELLNYEGETYSHNKKLSPTIKVDLRFPNVVQFWRALNNYAIINEFKYFIDKSKPMRVTASCANLKCKWKIYAYVMKDGVTFKVRSMTEAHTCIRSNKGGNKYATQGWIAEVQFKKKIRGDFFNFKLWGAARAYCVNDHDRLVNEIASVSEEAVTYLRMNHKKIWSQSKFGTTSKCDHITNNISEAFNAWVGYLRYKPVLDLLDGIRENLIV
nr:hypothetical protein [Tanacetum cinerariifolium]